MILKSQALKKHIHVVISLWPYCSFKRGIWAEFINLKTKAVGDDSQEARLIRSLQYVCFTPQSV